MQTRVNEAEDFLIPPGSYFLYTALIKIKWKTQTKNEIDFIIRGENLLNTRYRDYLNRLRYFADDLGRNIYVNINFNF